MTWQHKLGFIETNFEKKNIRIDPPPASSPPQIYTTGQVETRFWEILKDKSNIFDESKVDVTCLVHM